jgi:hypothetical protein
MRYNLGDKVLVGHCITKYGELGYVHWERNEFPESITGIVVGFRVVQNGLWERDWEGYSYTGSKYFVPNKYISCYLVATGLRNKHLNVLPEDMGPIEETLAS